MALCKNHDTECIAHEFIDVAKRIGFDKIHLSLSVFEENPDAANYFPCIGVSVHSLEQANRAVYLGADYLIAGHVFSTDSKKGLAPKGLLFLKELCEQISVPVYAIGGISEQNISAVRDTGAAGACMMSSFMQNTDISSYITRINEALKPN
jgi:thiamine-phosphate pyrophosphorylase